MPTFLKHVHHFIMSIGMVGLFIKLYRPSESNKLFDGGSLVLYVVAIAFYLINLRVGAEATVTGEWGDVDQNTGINVIAATQVFIVFALLGILAMQFGQYWAEAEDAKIARKAYEDELKSKKQEEQEQEQTEEADQSSNKEVAKEGGRKRETKKSK